MSNHYHHQIEEVIDQRARQFEADWLHRFKVTTRPRRAELIWFAVDPACARSFDEQFSHLDPKALQVFQGGHVTELPGYGFEDFARGAATVVSLLPETDVSWAMDLVQMQLDAMVQRAHSWENPYPAIEEGWLSTYASAVTLTLLSNEPGNWLSLLTYTLGVLWMVGVVDTLSNEVDRKVAAAVLHRVKLGTYHV